MTRQYSGSQADNYAEIMGGQVVVAFELNAGNDQTGCVLRGVCPV